MFCSHLISIRLSRHIVEREAIRLEDDIKMNRIEHCMNTGLLSNTASAVTQRRIR